MLPLPRPRWWPTVVLALAGCAPAAGAERGACYPNNTCNEGLACLSSTCVVDPHSAQCPALSGDDEPEPTIDTMPMPMAVKPPPDRAFPAPPAPIAGDMDQTPEGVPELTIHPAPDPSSGASPEAGAGGDTRIVVFRVWPSHVSLVLDGKSIDTAKVELETGKYVLKAGDRCCEPLTTSFTVVSGPGIQIVAVTLRLKPAVVALHNAPEGGVATCDDGIVLRGDVNTIVRLPDATHVMTCRFFPGGTDYAVTLSAGGLTSIYWPN